MIENFEPERLRLARELKSLSQTQLARLVGVSSAALSQFESGATPPSPATRERLATALGVPSGFFAVAFESTHEGFFRSLRRTSVADRRKARAVAQVVHDLVSKPAAQAALPAVRVPQVLLPLEADRSEVEAVALHVRELWKLPKGPIPNVVETLERHGVIVMRLPMASADVDAFSLPFADRPVIVLSSDKADRGRSRFDAAHELGHLVLHGEQVWGLKSVEDQAHWFAASFLMPADQIGDQLPTSVDWPRLFALKQEWHVSLASLLMRARSLKRMDEQTYLTAIKMSSARGWRRTEPMPLGDPERPTLLPGLLSSRLGPALSRDMPEDLVKALAEANAV